MTRLLAETADTTNGWDALICVALIAAGCFVAWLILRDDS